MILPRRPSWIYYDWLVQQGRIEVPRAGVAVNQGTLVEYNGAFYQCAESGTTGTTTPVFNSAPGATTVDGDVLWTSIGPDLPTGSVFFIATTAGVSGSALPAFDNAAGATTADGDVVWTSLGEAEVPIGGVMGETPRSAYFPTERGGRSIEYLICLARARLRLRSRVVQISFDCAFDRALALSCRKNATVYDPRLPGGVATGKIVAYQISANGDSGVLKGTVTVGCAVGTGASLTLANGTPTYVAAGYVSAGYQYEGAGVAISDDIGYTLPAATNDPEAISFPLTRATAVKYEQVHGTLAEQETLIKAALAASVDTGNKDGADYDATLGRDQGTNAAAKLTVADAVKKAPIWYELELVSLSGGPFNVAYYVSTTPLVIPKAIDLEAAA